ncbi:ImmA/IrrE family metallo-endopeptidase [Hydrogenophaga sp.]|uniref:ImmA/IrrE family metallo-endopeptidase n=1 Tax=Hydrogenophaga sp. TaxID=1904254 RepID=UPI003F719F8F
MSVYAEFCPAWASPPSETIRELARRKGLKRAALASAVGVAENELPWVLDGDFPIDEVRAEKLAAQVGGSPRFWLTREAQYRQAVKSIHDDARAWVSNLPFADMAKFGWLEAASTFAEKLRHAFAFFGVSSVDEWREAWLAEHAGLTAYRTSPFFTTQAAAAAAWLRQGELEASRIHAAKWSRTDFELLLSELKPLTRLHKPSEFLPQLQHKCAAAGVAVVIVRAPRGCPASGATRVRNGQAILQLSARYLRDDSFWFTFFHEAGHLILHEERLFLEWSEKRNLDEKEELEANDFAGNILIPPSQEAALRALPHEYKSIMRFARNLSVSPGIVVGQLQHRGLVPREKLNFLKKRYAWA